MAVDFVSKWVEAIELANNEGKSVTAFLKKNIYFPDLAPQGLLLVMEDLSFATRYLSDYWENMGFSIMWTLLTILKLVGKLRCQTRRLSKFWQKW